MMKSCYTNRNVFQWDSESKGMRNSDRKSHGRSNKKLDVQHIGIAHSYLCRYAFIEAQVVSHATSLITVELLG